MRSGNLKHKIIIQSSTVTKDDYGAEVSTWEDFTTVYSSIEPLRGQELFASQQTYNKVISKIRLRYIAGIKTDMRVNYNGRLFDIEAIINIRELNKELHLVCSEIV